MTPTNRDPVTTDKKYQYQTTTTQRCLDHAELTDKDPCSGLRSSYAIGIYVYMHHHTRRLTKKAVGGGT